MRTPIIITIPEESPAIQATALELMGIGLQMFLATEHPSVEKNCMAANILGQITTHQKEILEKGGRND